MATVVSVRQPSPRDVGARMAFSDRGQLAGSVTWGCVEGAVISEAESVLKSGESSLLHFGTVTDTTFELGLTCGGDMDIYVERLDPSPWLHTAELMEELLLQGKPCAVVTIVEGEPRGCQLLLSNDGLVDGATGDADIDREITAAGLGQLSSGESMLLQLGPVRVFVDVHMPPPRVVIVGAGHVSIPLVTFAETLGYRTFVIDPRSSLLTRERFHHASRTFTEWPAAALEHIQLDENTFLVLVTHDPKLDDPVIRKAVEHDVSYIGALGSTRTHAKRVERLRDEGLSEEQLNQLHAPIGLDLGGRDPEEIALAIMAEIVQVRRSGKSSR